MLLSKKTRLIEEDNPSVKTVIVKEELADIDIETKRIYEE